MLLANRVLIGSFALGAPVLADESGPAIDEKAQPDSAVRGRGGADAIHQHALGR